MARHRGPYSADHDDEPAPRRGNGRNRRRRRHGGAAVAFAAALAVVLAVAAAGVYVFNGGRCGSDDIRLKVAASPDIAPALDAIAADFNEKGADVDGRCVAVRVRGVESADVAYGITGAGPTSGDTESEVWVPDSSLWPDMVRNDSGDAPVTDTGTSVARSPLVLTLPQDAAEGGGSPPASWKALVPTAAASAPYDVHVIDPVRSSSGLATLALVAEAVGDEEESKPQLIAALQTLQKGMAADEKAAFASLGGPPREKDPEDPEEGEGGGGVPTLVLSEQAAARYNDEHPDAPAKVGYPEGGTYSLDYPYVLRTADPVVSRAAEAFRKAVAAKSASAAIAKEGFRTPDGAADPDVLDTGAGFQRDQPEMLPAPTDKALISLTQAWNQLKLNTRLLALVDISGSMAEPVPGTPYTRMDVTAKAATQGLGLFPEASEIGLWEFSVRINNDLDYRETVPLRPLNADVEGGTQKDALAKALSTVKPKPDGDTGLYDSILAAHRELSRTYRSDRVNTILVLTDGNNDDKGSIGLKKLVSTLKDEFSQTRPVAVISIAFGPDVDPEPLREIAAATHGAAYSTDDPTEIGEIFLKSFALRIQGDDPGDAPGAGG